MRMKKVANGDIPPRFLEQALPPSVRGTALWAGTGNVVCVPRTTTIMGVVKTMMEHGVRRVPVVDAGTHRLEGVMYTTHIVDFLGGGSLHNLVKNKYDGNLLAAINEDVRAIMERGVPTSTPDIHVLDAIGQMAEKGVGGLILLNTSNQVVGIFTERDVLKLITEDVPPELSKLASAMDALDMVSVDDVMSRNVVCADADDTLQDGMRLMISRGFRRLPLIKDGVLIGLITSSDVIRYLGGGDVFARLVGASMGEALTVPLKSLVRQKVLTTEIKSSIKSAALSMRVHGVGSLPVVDEGELAGIITERDIVCAIHEGVCE
ncbi:MAG: CBS domain-containing protein [Methermicoccaceae archaeon]